MERTTNWTELYNEYGKEVVNDIRRKQAYEDFREYHDGLQFLKKEINDLLDSQIRSVNTYKKSLERAMDKYNEEKD